MTYEKRLAFGQVFLKLETIDVLNYYSRAYGMRPYSAGAAGIIIKMRVRIEKTPGTVRAC